ncbi:MAG: hypothetical protein HC837_12230 [Chloroflexaceae bacterium]|nr:hypothetical protein [Chloroflexaceae bacterium]
MTTLELIEYLRQHDIQLWLEGDRLRYSAPGGALTSSLRATLTARKAEIIAFLRQRQPVATGKTHSITAVSREGELPLSFAQQRLWFLEQLKPGRPVYTIPAVFSLTGSLDRVALEQSVNALVARHESLRTCFQPNRATTPGHCGITACAAGRNGYTPYGRC